MNTTMLGLLAETPIHPGSGRSVGVVDLPVAREAATDYPVIVGSSLKGALRDRFESRNGNADPFGSPDKAGDLLVSDARLLLLPVRSLTGSYRWITCPHILERYRRDLARAGLDPLPEIPAVQPKSALAEGESPLFLEERMFKVAGRPPGGLADSVAPLLLHQDTRQRLAKRIAVLHDDDFSWFARYGLSIQARNALKDGTKTSDSLWYEETLPPDTVMYALVLGRGGAALASLEALFPPEEPYLQAGGNETLGHGWFAVRVRRGSGGGAA